MVQWIADVLEELLREKQLASQRPESISAEFNAVVARLADLDVDLTPAELASLTKGVRALQDSLAVDGIDRLSKIREATAIFHQMSDLAVDPTVENCPKPQINDPLISLGGWGLVQALNISGDPIGAALEVYETSSRVPLFGVHVFPISFFSNDFRSILFKSSTDIKKNYRYYNHLKKDNSARLWRSIPILIFRTVAVVPWAAFSATIDGVDKRVTHKRKQGTGQRPRSFKYHFDRAFAEKIGSFDRSSERVGLGREPRDIRKQETFLDQVSRNITIHQNHCLRVAQESKNRMKVIRDLSPAEISELQKESQPPEEPGADGHS